MSRLLAALGLFPFLTFVVFGQPTALTVDPRSREEVRQFYRAIYHASENVPMSWTGNYATGNAGDTSAAFKEATRLRINFYRALVGVPAGITFNAAYNAATQQAALMQSVNAASGNIVTLNHNPPPSWTFYSAAGADASAKSNLYYGRAGADAVTGYIADAGPINTGIGHRRWLFLPQTLQMGTGDVPGDGTPTRSAANAIWILDTTPGGAPTAPRPATRSLQISYPPAGYAPYPIVFPRWSFSYPAADFSATTVTMTRAGQNIPVRIEPLNNATIIGENTVVWVFDNLDTDSEAPLPQPAADTAYGVTLNNVRIGGVSQNFTYTVTVFDPDVAGADFVPAQVAGPAVPSLNQANAFSVTRPAFASAFDWRTLQFSASNTLYNAETGLDGLTASTTGGYAVVQGIVRAGGAASYRLAHNSPLTTQSLTLPGTYLVGPAGSVNFSSRIGVAVPSEFARVQVSLDDGDSWLTVHAQAGTSQAGTSAPVSTETAFVARSISLAAYAGRTVRVRLAFTGDSTQGGYVPSPDNIVGWFIDNLTLADVQTVTASAFTRVTSGNAFSFQPTVAGAIALQARGVLFGTYPIEWGSALPVIALDANAANNPGRLVNLSILTALTPTDTNFTMGYVVGGSGTSGPKPVLIRAAGPSLSQLGVTGVLEDPKLELFAGSAKSGENDNWGGTLSLSGAMARVGAFAYATTTSRDSAVLSEITTSNNSAVVSSANNGTGTVIAEIYDSTPTASFTTSTPRLVNVSVLKHLGSGLTAGFVIGGSTSQTVLVRAIGPTIGANPFNVGGVVADPQLTLFAGPASIATNDNWGGTPALTAAFAKVGAFALPAGSRDAALVVTLQPGNYTAQVSGVGNSTGVALVEVYEVP